MIKAPLFAVTENDRRIYEEQIRDFLPDQIIDIHTHVWRRDLDPEVPSVRAAEKRTVTWPSLVAADNSIEDLRETYRLLFPGKEVTPLIFGAGRAELLPARNAYVRKCAAETGYPALYYSRPTQSPDEIEEQIRAGGFLGLKSYLSLAPAYLPGKEIRIFDFFPKRQLERLNQMGGAVMLHVPRDGRLRDPVNLGQILELKREFPRVRLIVAHIGRAYVESDVGGAFETLSECKDLLFDFSANCCEYAITRLLEAVGPGRVMFGSDLPILRMRTRRIEENGTYINLVPPGLYGDPAQDPHLREVSAGEAEKITFFMYEEILAFRRAAEKLGLSREDVERVFCRNARELLEGAARDIYGQGG